MSTTVDQRVVEMRFDNKHFEQNVSTTISSLGKLNQSLNLTGASKGLESINTAAKNCDLSGISNGCENVKLQFSAMYTIADQALRNITNSAMAAGKRIVSALTIDPVKTGFSEYETKINAIQTIMSNTASKGTTMEDVTRVIGELNTYADKTIYNFAEMTRNIGTFTAAGIGLEDSAAAIQGIANLAAASGSSSQQASTAMYQLSQALSTGTVRLMDWNSVVNAGMGGEKFQEALKATAREYGVEVDDIIEANGSFRDSLQDGWLSAEILNETLQKFTVEGAKDYAKSMVDSGKYTKEQADALIKEAQAMEDAATKVKTFTQLWDTLKESAQSGWSQTWEILIGDFEEAKETLTKVSDTIGGIIGKSAEARNALLQGWKDAGGRADLMDSIANIFDGIVSAVRPIKDAFRDIFPAMTVDKLIGLTKGLKEFTERLKLSDAASDKLKRTFKGLFAVVDIVGQVFSAIFKAVGSLFGGVGDLSGGILSVTAAFGDWLVKMNNMIKSSNIFNKILQPLSVVIKAVFSLVGKLVGAFGDKIAAPGLEILYKLLEKIQSGITKLVESASKAFSSLASMLEGSSFFKLLESLWKGITAIGAAVGNVFGKLFGGLIDKLANADFGGILDVINAIVTGGVGIGLMKFLKSLTGTLEEFKGIGSAFTGILDGVRGCFEAYQNSLNAEALIKLAKAIAILTVSILVLSFIDSAKLSDSLGAIATLFTELLIGMAIFSKIAGPVKGVLSATMAMKAMATSVLILALAMRAIADLEIKQLMTGLAGIAGLMAIVVGAVKVLGKGGKSVVKGATQMVIFAAAIKILASVCKDLSQLSWGELAKGLVGVGALMAEISIFLNTAKFSVKSVATATGIVILSSALKILASVCGDFAGMKWGEIGKGLASIAGLLAEITIFTRLTGGAKHVISTGIALIAIAGAMKIFASAIGDMGSMSWGEIARGLVAMAGALAAVTIALHLMPKNLVGKGVGLIAISTALLILSSALGTMGGMSWSEVARGLVALGGALIILAVGLHAMKGTLAGTASLLIASNALLILAPVLALLGSMSWSAIAKGLITLAGAFTIIGIAAAILKPCVITILALSGALTLIGLGVLAAGAGLMAFGAGLAAIAVGITTLAGSISIGAAAIVSLVTSLVTGIIKGVGAGIVAFCEVIADGATAIGKAVKAVILAICDVLVDCVPVITDSLLKLVVSVLESLVDYAPRIIDALFNFLILIIDGLSVHMPRLIQSVMNLLASLFQGVIDALGSIDVNSMIKGISAVGLMAGVMYALASVSALTLPAMKGVLGMGVVIAELALVLAAIGALAQIPGLNWLINEGAVLMRNIGNAIGNLIGGIIGGVAEGFTASLPQIAKDLSAFMTDLGPFIDGAKTIDSSVMDGVLTMVGVILALTGANLIEKITSWLTGGASLVEFGKQLVEFGPMIKKYADSVAGIDASAIKASANAAKSLAEMTNAIPNEGGMISWFTGDNSLASFAGQLPALGTGLKSFSDSVAGIVPENLVAATNAAKALAEMTNIMPNQGGVVSWFQGDQSLSKLTEELPALGTGLKAFSDSVAGVVPENLTAATNAAKALAEITNILPNQGGVASWFAGDQSLATLGEDIVGLGKGLKGFSDSVAGVMPENLTAATNAARALAELTNILPNQGGVVSWFAGDQSLSKFGNDLIGLGKGLKGFSDSVAGVVPENLNAAANSAKGLAELTNIIPNQGGVVSWFTGEQSLSKFGDDLSGLGKGLKGFSDSVTGIVPENVTAAANSAKALAEMANVIPNEGGIKAWFTGDASISSFGEELPELGKGLKGFSDSVTGIVPENLTAAANAAKALAEMSNVLPSEGGIKAWFAGEESVSKFSSDLKSLGAGLKGFSDSVVGVVPENITAGANSAKTLAELANVIPAEGGIRAWISGEKSLSKFGGDLVNLGTGLKGFSDSIAGVVPENITSGADAAKTLAELTNVIPNQGGVSSWFTGEQSLSKFSLEIISLGKGLKGFSDSISGISPENITAAASAAKSLAEITNVIPNQGGISAWFSGDQSLSKFGGELPKLGAGLKSFSDSVAGISPENITAAARAAKDLASMTSSLPKNIDSLDDFGKSLSKFAGHLRDYFLKTQGISAETTSGSKAAIKAVASATKIDAGKLNNVAKSIDNMVDSVKGLSKVTKSSVVEFKSAMEELGKVSTKAFLKEFDDLKKDMKKAGKNAIESFIDGVDAKKPSAERAIKNLARDCADAAEDKASAFRSAGREVVVGFAEGISANIFKAEAKAKAMAKAALKAAEKVLDINSPSKEAYRLGDFTGLGYVNALDAYVSKSYDSGAEIAKAARSGLSDTISRISKLIDSDMDAQPTIRPVLDLSDVRAGVGTIGDLFGAGPSIGVLSNVRAIGSMTNRRSQNGGTSDIVSEIAKLRNDLGNVGNTTYSINGVTYDDGSNIAEAVRTIVRAAKVERRA